MYKGGEKRRDSKTSSFLSIRGSPPSVRLRTKPNTFLRCISPHPSICCTLLMLLLPLRRGRLHKGYPLLLQLLLLLPLLLPFLFTLPLLLLSLPRLDRRCTLRRPGLCPALELCGHAHFAREHAFAHHVRAYAEGLGAFADAFFFESG